jgi:3-dehydroquinate synthase
MPLGEQSYDVYIEKGIINQCDRFINPEKEIVIITDDNIPQAYIDVLTSKLNVKATYILNAGESLKNANEVNFIIESLIKKGITRSVTLIALGGGVIGDLTGFIASIYMRGVDFIQIPTSLLSQIDSSIGGKVGINTSTMKNAVGSFYQPKVVLIDPDTLDSLEERHFNNGMAELIKHALIDGKGLFKDLIEKDIKANIEDFIYRSLLVKKAHVINDVQDKGVRQILNFGHTIGHALEQYSNYELLHGEAIAIGMLKMAKGTDYEEDLKNLFHKFSLVIEYPYDQEKILEYIKTDKKVIDNTLNLIVIKEVGNPFIKPIKVNDITEYM